MRQAEDVLPLTHPQPPALRGVKFLSREARPARERFDKPLRSGYYMYCI